MTAGVPSASGKARVRPVRIAHDDDALGVKVIRGVGFRVIYADGSRGPVRSSWREARRDLSSKTPE